jgi:hypothetical protein
MGHERPSPVIIAAENVKNPLQREGFRVKKNPAVPHGAKF